MIDVAVTTRGRVSAAQRRSAQERLGALGDAVPDPVLAARVMLRGERNPRLERPARAEGELDVNGRLICARVAAPSMPQAISALADVLERRLQDFGRRRERRQRIAPQPPPGQWRHASFSQRRPDWLRRPPQQRELVRRKTFAVEPLDPVQATREMLDLDHDFYLFRDAATGADAVVYRRDDGRIATIEQAGAAGLRVDGQGPIREPSRFSEPIALRQAIEEMNALSHRFMFFVDAQSGRGNVIYMRYDGNYGLIEPAASSDAGAPYAARHSGS